ncbi:protocatechuate 3,4-dioxygenase subunit alpha [Hamadaea sp. NPDC051192]|uniref:protocatechuate 3,4-dioxygenase subunit alpha n=1 Tax=Hamadaea sp. NPDC051192 TaxID=3154940 RepID=UPI00341B0096
MIPTPSQTVGPFFSLGLDWPDGPYAVADDVPGAIWLRGRIVDGAGDPVPEGMIEIWQADPAGRFAHPDDPRGSAATPGFRGFARCGTDPDGRYAVRTVKPGPVPGDGELFQAPHIDVSVFARGLLDRLVTRVYFADEPAGNAADPVLAVVDPERRSTLLAQPGPDGYTFDIVLQGDHETVFFAV